MVTQVRPDALKTATRTAEVVLFAAAGVLLVLGAIIWTGQADQLIPVHELAGIALVLSFWTIAAIAARSGVSAWLVAAAVAWSFIAPILGMTQGALVEGDWHWTIQVLHLLVGVGVVIWSRVLVIAMRKAI